MVGFNLRQMHLQQGEHLRTEALGADLAEGGGVAT